MILRSRARMMDCRAVLALTLLSSAAAAASPSFTTIYSFAGGTDGLHPAGPLALSPVADDDTLYGTTCGSNCSGGGGGTPATVFTLTPPGPSQAATETPIHHFGKLAAPHGGVIFDASGHLYGPSLYGGAADGGFVFKMRSPTTADPTTRVLYSFAQQHGPTAPLAVTSSGALYGTTKLGGANDYGTIFRLKPQPGGTWTKQTLYRFAAALGAPSDPTSGVAPDGTGGFYGTTDESGEGTAGGVVYDLRPPTKPGKPWTLAIVYSFSPNSTDGYAPVGGVVADAQGNLYGTTATGGAAGANGCGTVYELSPPAQAGDAWTETTLHSFNCGSEGGKPLAGVTFDGAGNLYGTTWQYGAGNGTVFELSPPAGGTGPWTETTVYTFTGGADGGGPNAELTLDQTKTHLYGSTPTGGTAGAGTIFMLTLPTL